MYVAPIGGVSNPTHPDPVLTWVRFESVQKTTAPAELSAGFVLSVAHRRSFSNFHAMMIS
jgi:hypothetical protein